MTSVSKKSPYISVVVPIYNEEANIPALSERLLKAMDVIGKPYEIIFTNDGSKDASESLLRALHEAHPKKIRVIEFNGNFGQHMAIIAAFEQARGEVVVTLDGDLQNPPEEIVKLLAKIEDGFDVVGGYRADRKDSFFRRTASRLVNAVRARITRIHMRDQGCMLRAYRRSIIRQIVDGKEVSTFIPALAYSYAVNPTEIEVVHDARASGESKYGLYQLARLNFDLITGFSLVPIQLFTFFGMAVSAASFLFVLFLVVRRIVIGHEPSGVWTEFAITYFLISIVIMGIGIVGEYIGRIYQEIRRRPGYVVREILEDIDD
jgi:undecaprenyl-phosphate 4-deoxy-4-formamido-L-arabinose transferase